MSRMKSPRDADLRQAFNHPLRRRIFRTVQDQRGGLSPREISRRYGAPLSNVSYHVRVLAKAKAIVCIRKIPVRGSTQHFYVVDSSVEALPWVQQITQIDATTSV